MMHSRSFFGLSGLLIPCLVLVMAFAVTAQEAAVNWPDFPASAPMDQDVIYLQRGDVWHTSFRGVETKSVEMSRSDSDAQVRILIRDFQRKVRREGLA